MCELENYFGVTGDLRPVNHFGNFMKRPSKLLWSKHKVDRVLDGHEEHKFIVMTNIDLRRLQLKSQVVINFLFLCILNALEEKSWNKKMSCIPERIKWMIWYIYVCVFAHVCVCVCVLTCACVCGHLCLCECVSTCAYVCMNVGTYTRIFYEWVGIHTHTHIYIYIYIYIYNFGTTIDQPNRLGL